MTSFHLKVLACTTMLIDHIGLLFFPDQVLFRIIGRLAFPLFAFLIAEGFLHTNSVRVYFWRLMIFGLLSQVPFGYYLHLAGHNPYVLNVFFTLILGLVALMLITSKQTTLIKSLGLVGVSILSLVFNPSYSLYGVLTVVASFVYQRHPIFGISLLVILPVLESLGQGYLPQNFAILSIFPILLYIGQKGTHISKWWFYAFYPVHFIVLTVAYLLLR